MCSLLHHWLNYFLFAVTMDSLEPRKAVYALNVTLQHITVDFKELNIHGGGVVLPLRHTGPQLEQQPGFTAPR